MNQTTIQKVDVEDLALCAVNDGEIYERCGQYCIKNLQRKVKRGIFDETKAPKLFEYLFLTLARKRYAKGIRMNREEKALFGKLVYEHYEEEIKAQ